MDYRLVPLCQAWITVFWNATSHGHGLVFVAANRRHGLDVSCDPSGTCTRSCHLPVGTNTITNNGSSFPTHIIVRPPCATYPKRLLTFPRVIQKWFFCGGSDSNFGMNGWFVLSAHTGIASIIIITILISCHNSFHSYCPRRDYLV